MLAGPPLATQQYIKGYKCVYTRDIMNISNAFSKHHDTYEMGGSQSDAFLSYICIGRRATSLRLSSLILLVMEGRCIDQNAIR